MKEYIIAKLIKIDQDYIYLLLNNICYKFFYSKNDIKGIKEDSEIKLYISNVWIENELKSFGFLNVENRNLFEILININTIGQKTVLKILDSYNYEELIDIFKTGNTDKILKIKGIGNYTAKLIINGMQKSLFNNQLSDKKQQVLISLEKLGYKTKDIYKVIINADDKLTIDQLTKYVLLEINLV
ncbi:Holliday junction DNA helicase RuvA [Mycoplasma yeatsii 13926]|uniref:Holliday junction branch migration complex subunit RuvA n=1 Tax=Mycoplasma yeatsii 13926 TaxID=1188240 RepID=S6G8E4_9MOLU|nr:Holliday junction branch migration protein RuvA [Mycoplasma yeatsii]EOA07404.1 Holliday junction DNA helicase RuvA [Mycoplasma yeatsii 13926]